MNQAYTAELQRGMYIHACLTSCLFQVLCIMLFSKFFNDTLQSRLAQNWRTKMHHRIAHQYFLRLNHGVTSPAYMAIPKSSSTYMLCSILTPVTQLITSSLKPDVTAENIVLHG